VLPVTRAITLLMAAVLCFGLFLPHAIARHNAWLGVFLVVIFTAYAAANVLLWIRLKRHASR